jgi:hypothetical protein
MEINISELLNDSKKIIESNLKFFCDDLIEDKQKECEDLKESLVLSEEEIQELQNTNSFSLTITEYDDLVGTSLVDEIIPAGLCKDGKKLFFILSKSDANSTGIYKSIDCSHDYMEELLAEEFAKYAQDNLKKRIIGSLLAKYTELVEPLNEFTKFNVELKRLRGSQEIQESQEPQEPENP